MNPDEMMAQDPAQLQQAQPDQAQQDGAGNVPADDLMMDGDPHQEGTSFNADMQDPSIGMGQDPNAAPDPMEALSHVVLSYMDYTTGIKNNKELAEPVRASIMLQMAQAINYFVPLLRDDSQMELQKMQAELEMKKQEHQMNMEMKQAEMQFKQQEMEMKLSHSQQENQMKLQHTEQQNQMQLQQGKENHEHSIVQSQESHQSKMEQQKQAAQVKASSKPVNGGGKK
jgi:hypothetical protein